MIECGIFLKWSENKPEKPKYKITGAAVPEGCKFEAFKFKFQRNKNCNKLQVNLKRKKKTNLTN